MARRMFGMVAAFLLLLFVVAACGDDDSDSSATTDSGGGGVTVTSEAAGTPVAVEVGDKSDTDMYMKVDVTSVPAGTVTFTLTNTGTKEHEMVILKTDTPADQLEVGDDNRVSEADSVGEISETPAGETVTKSFDLEAGAYVLVCNIAGHYAKGMYSAFTVTS